MNYKFFCYLSVISSFFFGAMKGYEIHKAIKENKAHYAQQQDKKSYVVGKQKKGDNFLSKFKLKRKNSLDKIFYDSLITLP